ncbi:MAG: hypothetical protein PHV42_04375, partial [Candidatus Pacebacteria bacterium]|nr:hypothetical protein [Candidatus Paceibacterota bacterium]
MDLKEAIKEMSDWASSSNTTDASCCLAYLMAIPKVIDTACDFNQTAVEGLKTQLLYALNNAQGWKGEIAIKAK